MRKIEIEIDCGEFTCKDCYYLHKGFYECRLFEKDISKERSHYYRRTECMDAEKID